MEIKSTEMRQMYNLEDKIKGGLYGVAIGDALGGTFEFMSRDEIRQKYGMLRYTALLKMAKEGGMYGQRQIG